MIETAPPPLAERVPNPIYAGPREPSETCRDEVVASLDDWRARLDAFYARIDEWCGRLDADPAAPPAIYKGWIFQRDEPPMRRFDVTPGMLPTRAILLGRNRVGFAPSSLWIKGARGRVNATTNLHQYAILDMSQSGDADWRLVLSKVEMTTIPFDEKAFQDLVRCQKVNAV